MIFKIYWNLPDLGLFLNLLLNLIQGNFDRQRVI
jgi:hypothetical protein